MSGNGVLVTGAGPVTPIGVGGAAFHAGQLAGLSGVRTITHFDPAGSWVRIAGEVDLPAELALDEHESARASRCTELALAAARLAIEDSGLDIAAEDPSRIGVCIGTGVGGAIAMEQAARTAISHEVMHVSPLFIPVGMANNPAASVSICYGLGGPCTAPVTACSSGAEALALAHQMIACGEADVVLAGGTEAPITPLIVAGFARMHALSRNNDDPEHASRPFSADRDGFVLAEGAAVLVLESVRHATARGAPALACLAGYGRSSDAYHLTRPRPGGTGAQRALVAAMSAAGVPPEKVSYVNAHGTGTKHNDAAEVAAMRAVLGPSAERTPVSSTKSQTGHTIGAAGAIEAVATIQALNAGVIPPTVNLDVPDPELGLDFVPHQAREAPLRWALSDSFAFGGHNVVLAFKKV